MAREGLVACALGFATGGVGTYALHRALWKCADAQARAIEALLPAEVRARSAAEDAAVAAARTRAEKMGDTLERYMRQRAAQAWNGLVDSVHVRLLNLPRTLEQIRGDAAAAFAAATDGGDVVESVEVLTEAMPEPELEAVPEGKPAE